LGDGFKFNPGLVGATPKVKQIKSIDSSNQYQGTLDAWDFQEGLDAALEELVLAGILILLILFPLQLHTMCPKRVLVRQVAKKMFAKFIVWPPQPLESDQHNIYNII